jgi:tetratricopeptide (TPR) repeat protein
LLKFVDYHRGCLNSFAFDLNQKKYLFVFNDILYKQGLISEEFKILKQIVEMAPTAQSYVLLGDAYMAIQEPERALEIYDQALRRNPKDSILRAKMGQVGKT